MTPQVLVVYTNTLFGRGLAHLLSDRADCTLAHLLPVAALTPQHLDETPATVVILEGTESDPGIAAATRLLLGRSASFVFIRVDLAVPMLHVYHCDRPVPAGLDELTDVIRRIADRSPILTAAMQPPGGPA